MATIAEVAETIQNLDFGWVFRLDGLEVVRMPEFNAPYVYHDEINDVVMDGVGWNCLTGLTNQYGYNGAVMDNAEFIGISIARTIAEYENTMFAIVLVHDIADGAEIGWAIAYRPIPTD